MTNLLTARLFSRYDLNPANAWSCQRLTQLIKDTSGVLRGMDGSGGGGGAWGKGGWKGKTRGRKGKEEGGAAAKAPVSLVPQHLMPADVSGE